jgi:hypothetical protein
VPAYAEISLHIWPRKFRGFRYAEKKWKNKAVISLLSDARYYWQEVCPPWYDHR